MFLISVSFGTQLFKGGLGRGVGVRRGIGREGWGREGAVLSNSLCGREKSPDIYAVSVLKTLPMADSSPLICHH